MKLAEQMVRQMVGEAGGSDDPSFVVSDAQLQVTQAIANLKTMQGAGNDHKDLETALKYLEAGAIFLGRIIQRNIQKR
jgi:hypothetical protein